MTEEELRSKIGLRKYEIFESSHGLIDILRVRDDTVYYGFLAFGKVKNEPVNKFLGRFKKIDTQASE